MSEEEEEQETPEAAPAEDEPRPSLLRSDAWTDLGLTLPLFVAYHLGVVFLPIRNAADPLTAKLREIADNSIAAYIGLTLLIGAVFVGVLVALGRGKTLSATRFGVVAIEGIVYATILRFAATYAMRALPLQATDGAAAMSPAFTGAIMSMGAGFYEEIAFRVLLFGSGAWVIKQMMEREGQVVFKIIWAAVTGAIFSAWHYVGPYGDPFDAKSFAYRAICGFVLALVYAIRGFAPAVWTHAVYDLWVLVF
jgi:hypothetical protein